MGYLSRIEALLESLLDGTEPPVTTPQSRVEAHLHAMINGDEITDDAKSRIEECLRGMMTDTVPQEKPKSRIEACIHAIITGSNPPEKPKSRSEVYLHAIWDKYHGGSEEPTPDVPVEPIVPTTGLVYELAEPMTFNGSSDYIDTGIKLYDEDKDFEIMIEFISDENYNMATLLHCMWEAFPWSGLTINYQTSYDYVIIINNNKYTNLNPIGTARLALVKINNYYAVKIMHEELSEPQLVVERSTDYAELNNNLLLGAYQENSGNKGRFWNGTISKCKVYIGELPSDEETNAFLMG